MKVFVNRVVSSWFRIVEGWHGAICSRCSCCWWRAGPLLSWIVRRHYMLISRQCTKRSYGHFCISPTEYMPRGYGVRELAMIPVGSLRKILQIRVLCRPHFNYTSISNSSMLNGLIFNNLVLSNLVSNSLTPNDLMFNNLIRNNLMPDRIIIRFTTMVFGVENP